MAKIDTKRGYFGLSHESEIFKFSWSQVIAHVTGELILSIGKGKFNEQVSWSMQQVAAWAVYHEANKDEK